MQNARFTCERSESGASQCYASLTEPSLLRAMCGFRPFVTAHATKACLTYQSGQTLTANADAIFFQFRLPVCNSIAPPAYVRTPDSLWGLRESKRLRYPIGATQGWRVLFAMGSLNILRPAQDSRDNNILHSVFYESISYAINSPRSFLGGESGHSVGLPSGVIHTRV